MANRVRLPPEDYHLNAFLLEIARKITPDELDEMKSLLKGPRGIGRGVLEDISNARDFFDKLQTTGYINVNDIVVLQALLWRIGRKDLYEKMVEFADQHRNVLHVSAPNPEPVNGYKYVKFHLKGELVRDTVEDLRARVASWLLVPTSFVVVSGVQPTGSWHITLMIPEICLENLLKFIDVKRHWLTDQNIDSVELDGKVIDIAAEDSSNPDQTQKSDVASKELLRLMDVNRDLEDQLEILQTQLITSKKELSHRREKVLGDMHGSDRRSDLIAGIDKLKQNIQDLLKHKRQMDDDINPLVLEAVYLLLDVIQHGFSSIRACVRSMREKLLHATRTDRTEDDSSKKDRLLLDHFWEFSEHCSRTYRRFIRRVCTVDMTSVNKGDNRLCKELHKTYWRILSNLCRVQSYLIGTRVETEILLSESIQHGPDMCAVRTGMLIDELQSVEELMDKLVQLLKQSPTLHWKGNMPL